MDNFGEEGNIEYLMDLVKLKKSGELDSEDLIQSQHVKWRNTVSYDLLEFWLSCADEEVRLLALNLLAVSKKSTLSFHKQELDLIIVALKFNLKEKNEHVAIIKKVLKRLNDSYAVFKRQLQSISEFERLQKLHSESPASSKIPSGLHNDIQSYHTFLHSMHRICLENLYPGAVNARRKSCLQILCLMDEILCEELKISLWNMDHFKILLDCLILDTYELNKSMSYQLLVSTQCIELLFNTNEKQLELISVALEMANSLRPLDSITASYMLKVSKQFTNIHEHVCTFGDVEVKDTIQENTVFCIVSLLKSKLEGPVQLASENIVLASSKHSLYGYVFCIHSILSTIHLRDIVNDDQWRILVSDIIEMCFRLNSAVSQIVNNSSPEGHLPMDLNPRHLEHLSCNVEEVVITPQMVLLCSWRTVKEISLFFGYLTSQASIYDDKDEVGMLTEEQVVDIGKQLVILLTETKHRGAFEQAHVGFGQLCGRLWFLEEKRKSLRQLPKVWLQQLLLAVVGFAPENSKLCATRRSAGVPFMVQALVTSEIRKRCDPKLLTLHPVMKILLRLSNISHEFDVTEAQKILFSENLFDENEIQQYLHPRNGTRKKFTQLNEITEIKTHALNILRALFRHCKLGELVQDYIADGFKTAFKSYDGESWAERNAATLLFSALVVRVFGVQRTKDHLNLSLHNKMTGKNFFDKFPSLLPFLVDELTKFMGETEDQIKPKIQSILLILSRLYPCTSSESLNESWRMDEFINLVSRCGQSRVHKTRELAARALVPLLTEKNILSILNNLMHSIAFQKLSMNLLHGYALQLLEIVRCQQFTKIEFHHEPFKILLNLLEEKILEDLQKSSNGPVCYPAATVLLDLLTELSKIDSCRDWIYDDATFAKLLERITLYLSNHKSLKTSPGIELFEISSVEFLITTLKSPKYSGGLIKNEYILNTFAEKLVQHENPEVLAAAWSNMIHIIRRTKSPLLFDMAFMKAITSLNIKIYDPEYQDAILEFIYQALVDFHQNDREYIDCIFKNQNERRSIYSHILEQLLLKLNIKRFYPREAFFKLLGKVVGSLLKYGTDFLIEQNGKKIYRLFSKLSSLESNIECRTGISEVLFDLYIDPENQKHIYLILEWWTTLLHLLYDDVSFIRKNGILVLSRLNKKCELKCETHSLDSFFEIFSCALEKNSQAVIAAFFCWSITAANVELEEMDDSDVFNRSSNYECFEPLQICNKCIMHLEEHLVNQNLNAAISKPVQDWIQDQLELDDDFSFTTFEDLIKSYKKQITHLDGSLKNILDPMYPAKLIKDITYTKFSDIVMP
ncbi:hypothetical protein QAD02_023895 [Eretmocerus hayati]|uniref:Uncharacterized protein n=1 Tax=Eretmocerus hayati TaxID=131215 RepID=A0ACC2PXH0_9HYME|nr:hypothetical protein QAD02_023895 [Eretmocerus hayati]